MKRTDVIVASLWPFLILLFLPIGGLMKGTIKIGLIQVWWAYPGLLLSPVAQAWDATVYSAAVIVCHVGVSLGIGFLIAKRKRRVANKPSAHGVCGFGDGGGGLLGFGRTGASTRCRGLAQAGVLTSPFAGDSLQRL